MEIDFCSENVQEFALVEPPEPLLDLKSDRTSAVIKMISSVCFQDLLLRAQANVSRNKHEHPEVYAPVTSPAPMDNIHVLKNNPRELVHRSHDGG